MRNLFWFFVGVAIAFFLSCTPTFAATTAQIFNGGTGTSTLPSYGKVLIGGKNGEYEFVATSTFGGSGGGGSVTSVFGRSGAVTAQSGDYSTSLIPEGANLYWTNTRFDNRLSATTSLPNITTLAALSLPVSQLVGLGATYPIQYAGGIFSLAFGTSTSNTWGGTQTFTNTPVLGALTGFIKASAGSLTTALINLTSDITGTLGIFNGGTGTTTIASGQLRGMGGTADYGVPTTTVTCTGSASCSQFTVIGSSPVSISATGGSGSADAFTHTTYGGQSVSATSTGVWFTGSPLSLIASSTFTTYASTTAFTNSGPTWLTNLSAGGLAVDANNKLYTGATSTLSTISGLLNLTSQVTGTLGYGNGGTGTTTAPVGQLLYGGSSAYQSVATSTLTPSSPLTGSFTHVGTGGSLGLDTSGTWSGNAGTVTNGVYTTTFNGLFDTRFVTDLAATTSIGSITALPHLSLPYAQLTGTPAIPVFTDPFTHPAAGQSATTSLVLLNGNASTTALSATQAFLGGTATSTINSTGNFIGVVGAEGTPTYSFAGDTGTGMFRVSGGILGWSIAGTGHMALNSSAFYPYTNDATALGLANGAWSDLFLATGGVINWGNSNVTLTHSSGALTLSSGTLLTLSYASTTAITATTASTTNLIVSGTGGSGTRCLHAAADGTISATAGDCGVAGSGITSLTAGEGLLGGTITTSGTITSQLGTSTTPVISNLPYFTSIGDATHPAKFGNVATTTLTGSGVISISNSPAVIGASGAVATLTGGSNGQVLAWASGVPTWVATSTLSTISGQLSLTSQVTGVLPYANGGTGTTTAPQGQLLYGGATAYQSVATGTVTVSGPITVTAGQSIIGSGLTIGCATCVTTARNVNTTYPLQGGGALSGDLTLSTAFSTTSDTGIGHNLFIYTSNTGVLLGAASSSLSLPNTALQNSTISGHALGTNIDNLSHDSTLTGTAYNGNGAVSNWGLDLTHANTWTGLQSFNGGASSTGEITATTASSTNLIISSAGGSGTRCLQVGSDGTVSANASACGTGSASDPFTHTTYNAQSVSATSTGVWFSGSPLSVIASSTFTTYASTTALTNSGPEWMTALSAGGLAVDANHKLYTAATSTLSTISGQLDLTTQVTGDLPFSNLAQVSANSVLGNISGATADAASVSTTSLYAGTNGQVLAFLGGKWTGAATTTFSTGLTYANGAVTCDVASASIPGCLSAANWTTFIAKQAPGFQVSTTSGLAISQLAYYTSTAGTTIGGVSTTTLSGSGVINVSNSPVVVGGSASAVTITGGSNGQVLGWSGGAPTWVATTTAGTGLSYNGTSFTVNTSQNIATLSNLTNNGFVRTSGSNGTLGVQTDPCTYAEGCTGSTTAPSGQLLYGGATTYQSVGTSTIGIGSTLSVTGGAFGYQVGGSNVSFGLNLGNANTWTALQQFNGGASSTGEITAATASSTNLIVSSAGGIGTRCLQVGSDGTVSAAASACGSGGGIGDPFTHSTPSFGTTTSATTTSILTQGVFFASSTVSASQFPYASTTAITATTASTTNLIVSSAGGTGTRCLQVGADGTVSAAGSACGTAGSGAIDPFTHTAYLGQTTSATSTLLQLTGAPYSLAASSTSLFDSATSTYLESDNDTWLALKGGTVGIGTTTPGNSATLGISGRLYVNDRIYGTQAYFPAGIYLPSGNTIKLGAFGSTHTALGFHANTGSCHGSTEFDSTYLGDGAGVGWTGCSNTFLGYSVANTSGTTGFNTLVGSFVGDSLADGAAGNTIVGAEAASALSSGTDNTILGSQSGATGAENLNTGTGNILIGYHVAVNNTARSNALIIGNSLTATADGQLNIGGLLFGTVNGVQLGVATTPTYNLDVAGNGHFTSLVDADHFVATSSSAASTFGAAVGVASTSPWGLLSVNGNALAAGVPQFVVGSSTATNFLVDQVGRIGIGTSSPYCFLCVAGDGITPLFALSTSTGTGAGLPVFQVNAKGHVISSGQKPTLTSCGAGSPSITGNDTAGKITTGTAPTFCLLTFANTYGTAPACTLSFAPASAVRAPFSLMASTSATTLQFMGIATSTGTAFPTLPSYVVSYMCMGTQ